MKKGVLSFAVAQEMIAHIRGGHGTPDDEKRHARMAMRPVRDVLGFDMEYQVWPSRAAMAKTIRMQEQGPSWENKPWRACQPLTPGEGY
jgi:hypothetical protein